eukprot:scaffold26793_cov30-Tisochrysis_lutea.AAC.2
MLASASVALRLLAQQQMGTAARPGRSSQSSGVWRPDAPPHLCSSARLAGQAHRKEQERWQG